MSQLNETNFKEKIIDAQNVALVTFCAEWCKPSVLQKTLVNNLKEKYSEKAALYVLDVDTHENLANEYHARTLPTSVLFAKGEMVEILAGYQPEDFLVSYLDHLIDKSAELDKAELEKKERKKQEDKQ